MDYNGIVTYNTVAEMHLPAMTGKADVTNELVDLDKEARK